MAIASRWAVTLGAIGVFEGSRAKIENGDQFKVSQDHSQHDLSSSRTSQQVKRRASKAPHSKFAKKNGTSKPMNKHLLKT